MSLKPPKPETKVAQLISAGHPSPTFTTHHYYETRPIVLPGPRSDKDNGLAWEHVFKCFETGAERRWGIEHRDAVAEPEVN